MSVIIPELWLTRTLGAAAWDSRGVVPSSVQRVATSFFFSLHDAVLDVAKHLRRQLHRDYLFLSLSMHSLPSHVWPRGIRSCSMSRTRHTQAANSVASLPSYSRTKGSSSTARQPCVEIKRAQVRVVENAQSQFRLLVSLRDRRIVVAQLSFST